MIARKIVLRVIHKQGKVTYFIFMVPCIVTILIRSNEMQQYAGVYLLQNYSTCFGCLSQQPSASGA